jgi:hypothetical protein
MSPRQRRRVYRTKETWRVGWLLALVPLPIWVVTLVEIGTSHAAVGDDWVYFAAVVAGLAVIITAVAIRAAIAAVTVDDHGVAVRNIFYTLRFEWSDIDDFGLGKTWWNDSIAVATLRNGEQVALSGVQGVKAPLRVSTGDAERVVDRLRDELLQARSRTRA